MEEDDFGGRKEDDLTVNDSVRMMSEPGLNPLRQETPGTILKPSKTVSDPEQEDRPIPHLPDNQEDKVTSFCKKDEVANISQPHVNNSDGRTIQGGRLEDEHFVDNTPHGITVNGRRLSYPRSSGKRSVKKISQEEKKNTPQRMKKHLETEPSSGKIWKYLTITKKKESEDRKTQEDMTGKLEDKNTDSEEDYKNMKKKNLPEEEKVEKEKVKNVKTTFGQTKSVKVKENIRMFQKLSMGEDCVIGSGRCSRHNVKLVRGVVMKKVSCVDKNGRLSWLMREVTSLSCPYKPDRPGQSAMMSSVTQSGETNGNSKKFRREDEDQSQTSCKNSGV